MLQAYVATEEEVFPGPPGFNVGSFPKDFGYEVDDHDETDTVIGSSQESKPRILLMGLRR